jgi:YD repeat-containing protein
MRVARMLPWIIGACLVAPMTSSGIPAIKRLSYPTLTTPDNAWAFYGSPSSPAIGTPTRPAEIKALARALSRGGAVTGDALAERVATYVRRNIETEFRFGLGKGARGAAIDQSGTPFDQAQLMVEILREAQTALNPSYKIGTLTLTADQFGKWTGFVKGLNEGAQTFTVAAQSACQMLASAGIPAKVNGLTDCAAIATSTDVTTVEMAHIWVMFNNKAYDPSYKPKLLRAGIDIAAAMGCGTEASPTCGEGSRSQALLSPAVSSTQSGLRYIERLNLTALETRMHLYSTNVQTAIAAVGRDVPIERIVGGAVPDDSYAPVAAASLSYQTSSQPSWGTTWAGRIPDTFRTTFRVQLHGLDVTVFADDVAGKRMHITGLSPAPPTGPNWSRTTRFYVDGVLTGTGMGTTSSLQTDRPLLTINHPYAAHATPGSSPNGTYGDQAVAVAAATDSRQTHNGNPFCVPNGPGHFLCNIGFSNIYTVVLQLGGAGSGHEQHYARMMGDNAGWSFPVPPGEQGVLSFGFAVHPPAAPLFTQATAAARLIGALSKGAVTQHHSMGVIFQNYLPGDGQPYLNITGGVSVASTTNHALMPTGAMSTYGLVFSALEGSIRQQSQDTFEAPSMVAMFKLFNDRLYRFFDTTSLTELNSFFGLSSNYSTAMRTILQGYATDGYSIILPGNALLGNYPMPGGGEIFYNIPAEYAYKADSVAPLIAEEFKGGGAVSGLQPVQTFVQNVDANTYAAKKRDYWSFDLASGLLQLAPPPDLTIGVPGTPGALEFRRSYASSGPARVQCAGDVSCNSLKVGGNSQIGGGWDHNLNRRASWSTNALEAFGKTSAIRAAGTIARLRAMVAIHAFSGTAVTTFERRMTGVFTAYSLTNALLRNSVVVEFPPASYSFIRLPNGEYSPPPTAKSASVSITGTPSQPFVQGSSVFRNYNATTIVYTDSAGAITNFVYGEGTCGMTGASYGCTASPQYIARETILPSGVQEKFNYDHIIPAAGGAPNKEYFLLTSVVTSKGNTINLLNTFGRLTSVNDGGGRSVTISCSMAGSISASDGTTNYYEDCHPSGASFANPRNETSRVEYGPLSGSWNSPFPNRIVGSWYTPLSPAGEPFLRFDYDPVLHLATITDNASLSGGTDKVSHFYVASVSDERWRLGEHVDASGALTSTEFDQYGRVLKITDPLGRVTTNRYDDAGFLVRTVNPENDAVEYQYDARGNQTRRCVIPKHRANQPCNTGSGDLAETATYVGAATQLATQCANRKTCNRPSFTFDARGNQTDYVWNSSHGDLDSVTGPADELGVRPQTSYTYETVTSTSTGTSTTFHRVSSMTEKIDAATSIVTSYGYEPVGNRFALKQSLVDSGGLNLRTCYKFDSTGNLISQTQPKALLGSCP